MRWNVDPNIPYITDAISWLVSLISVGAVPNVEIRWYGLLFASGLLLAAYHAPRYFKLWGLPRQHADRLTLWLPVGMMLGAHYVHLAFYEWDGLFDFPRFVDGQLVLGRFFSIGSGLASHGGALGTLLALLLFWYRNGRPAGLAFHRYADATMIVALWVPSFVRVGNFVNSEIVGRPSDVPWAVIFERHGYSEPRHPVVLYEAILYAILLAWAVLWFQPRYARRLRPGTTFYLMMLILFVLRFFVEFFKDSQHVDVGWTLNMGQYLSLPIIVGCAYLLFGTKRFNLLTPLSPDEVRDIEASAERAATVERSLDQARKGASSEPPPQKEPGSKKKAGKRKKVGA